MKRLTLFGSMIGALGLAMMGCGDNHQTCGEGTYEDDGVCLPDGTGATCGQGTVMDVSGECVPSDEVCAEGTVFVEGECVPEDDTLTADLEEEAEPNDGFEKTDDVAGSIALEDVGDGTSFHGCITPYRDLNADLNMDVDYDMWLVTVEEPSLIDVTADGVHGLSAGFLWLPASQTTLPLSDANWSRFGINLATDTSSRQVYLPFPGTYALVMSDSRSLFLAEGGAGSNDETCYYTSIEKVAIPTPTAATADVAINGTIGGDTLFYSYNPAEGDLVQVTHLIESQAASGAVLALRNTAFRAYGEMGVDAVGDTTPASLLFGGMADADSILLVVEPVYNYAQVPVNYNLMVHPFVTTALPTDGTTESGVANLDEAGTWETLDDVTWMWFDVGANEVVHFDMQYFTGDACKGPCDARLDMAFIDADAGIVSDNLFFNFYFGGNPQEGFDGWVRFPAAGRYYAAFFPPNMELDQTFDVESTVNRVIPGAATLGTPIVGAPFTAYGVSWRSLDGGTSIWMGVNAAATGFGTTVDTLFYDPTAIGVIDRDIFAQPEFNIDADGADDDAFGYITFGQPNDYLVGVFDGGGEAGASATYDLTIENRDFTDLATITIGTDITRNDEASVVGIDAGGDAPYGKLYLVRGTAGTIVTITATPAELDVGIELLARNESVYDIQDPGFAGDVETLVAVMPEDGYLAFRIYDWDDVVTDRTFDLVVSAAAQDPYTESSGTLVYQNICDDTGAELLVLDLGNRDDGYVFDQTLPFDFAPFGIPSGNTYDIVTNGFIAFSQVPDPFWNNTEIPSASAPNGVVAPYWDDLDFVTMCRLEAANQVTIQWEGQTYGAGVPVRTQVVIHDTGVIDFIYGGTHLADGISGTVGVQVTGALIGHEIVFNENDSVLPNTSFTLTP